jgi:hypothetical protein
VTAVDAHLRYFERGLELFSSLEPFLQHAQQARDVHAECAVLSCVLCLCCVRVWQGVGVGTAVRLLLSTHSCFFLPPGLGMLQLIERLRGEKEVQQSRMEALIQQHKAETGARDSRVGEAAAASREMPTPRQSGPLQVSRGTPPARAAEAAASDRCW